MDFWAPASWKTIHCLAAGYRSHQAQDFINFMYSFTKCLCCEKCCENAIGEMKAIPLEDKYLKNNENLFLWTYLLHDAVNRRLGKTSPPYEEVKSIYFKRLGMYDESKQTKNTFWGSSAWKTIHCAAACYKPHKAKYFQDFIYSFVQCLCDDEYIQNTMKEIKNNPLEGKYLDNNDNLFLWSYLLHDSINRLSYSDIQLRKNDKKLSPPLNEVKAVYYKRLGVDNTDGECKACSVN